MGIEISIGSGVDANKRLMPNPNADQSSPRRCYVYGHFDENGVPFYIGKGIGRRAWRGDRHRLWCQYVENHLNGKYSVIILDDDLNEEDAEWRESDWIAQESETLVNWQNMGGRFDMDALDKFHELRDANRNLCACAKALEKSKLAEAISTYYKALKRLDEYANIEYERGLVGELLREERLDIGVQGDHNILDRLTLCLIGDDRAEEASDVADAYFKKYRADLRLAATEKIRKRVSKALKKRREKTE